MSTHGHPRRRRDCRSRKLRLPDHESAVLKLQELALVHPGRKYLPFRTYQCPYCKGYHLSSKEEE